MRYYELLYIVNPNFEDDKVNSIIDEIGKEIEKYKVSIINHYVWGKKRLAYPIKNNKYGIYILLQMGAEQFDFLKEFERYLILSKSVIRHQIIKLEDEPKKVENIEAVVEEAEPSEDEVFDIPEEVPVAALAIEDEAKDGNQSSEDNDKSDEKETKEEDK